MIVNMLLLAISCAVGVGIFCRLNKLNWREHKAGVIVFNIGLLGAVLSTGEHAWIDAIDLQDVCILVTAICWIALSYKSWKDRPPDYLRKEPREPSRS